ncbi:MAG: hypothetical protein Tp1102DCM295711_36 [Prokaryotic dsDNA virus sp.]|nr:MAG: hypothetical protein Tp1102DCM295711_36 [Prokaryotic dsDNA virus sp.]|tara:strand:+ start:9142 stop:11670 length:2529 start_codon:yes stop_codon:yes gene_type:complete
MAFSSNIKKSNISENWLFQLEYYNGDSQGDGGGGFDQIFRSDGTTANLINEAFDDTDTSLLVDNNTMFEAGDFIKIDSEIMLITEVSSGAPVITVVRGAKGTTAATHSDNSIMFWDNYLPISFSDFSYNNVFYHGVITNNPSIRESIDLKKCTSKSSNISITIPDFKYKGSPISHELFSTHKYINRVATVYSVIDGQALNKIASFRVSDIQSNGIKITINLVSHRPWDNISVPQVKTTTNQNYFPIVYGKDFTGSSSSYASPSYIETFSKKLWPVKIDKYSYFFQCLLHEDFSAGTSIRLRYYEKGFDAFVPLETALDSESYENGISVRTYFHLRRHFKFKPTAAISKTFSDVANIIDGTADQTISDTFAEMPMDKNSAGVTTTLTKDNVFNFPAFDDPPDITSDSSTNFGFVIEIRWKMIDFYGTTGDSNGLTANSVTVSNNSRYTTGNISDSVAGGTTFATNGTFNTVNASTGSSNAVTINETTSSTNGATTATEFTSFPYQNGLSIRFTRLVTSATDGTGTASSGINSDLQVADLRCKVTCRIDKFNTTTDGFARIRDIDRLYCANDGLDNGITGLSGQVEEIHQAHLDLLNRFCDVDVATNPNTNIDGYSGLDSARNNWDIRYWIEEPESLEKVLNKLQFEGQFVFRFKQGDFTQPQYVFVPDSPSSILTLSKNDISDVDLEVSNPTDIVTKTTVNYDKHPALGTYQNTVTGVNSTSRKNNNIQSKENIKEINLDALVNNIGDTDPTGEDKNDNFLAYINALFGDIYLNISLDIVNPSKWVDSSLDPVEVGDIIDFNNDNMFPVSPLGFNSNSWNGLNFIIVSTKRSLGKLSIKARSL